MNKKLLALAIGAAVAMPVAALADGPTLYGKINVSLESQETSGPFIGDSDQWAVESNASRIGVKGEAATGVDGLKGVYVAEFGIGADDGSAGSLMDDDGDEVDSVLTQRNIYAGLSGDFGTVIAGNVDTPLKSAQGKVDQFNDTNLDMAAFIGGELRAPNAVAYISPKIADSVTVTVAVWQGEGAVNLDGDDLNGIGDALSASVVYENEGLYLALAMDQETPVSSGTVNSFLDLVGFSTAPAVSANDITRVVAGYTTDSFEVGALFSTGESSTEEVASDSWLLSGAYKTGDWKFKAQYIQSSADGDDLPFDIDGTALAIGADYALGKATTVGAFYGTQEMEFEGFGESAEFSTFGVALEQRF